MKEYELMEIIAKNLIYYRKTNHMTQTELAEKIGYSDKSISKWERAEGLPDVLVLSKIARLFDITVNDLLADKKVEPKIKIQQKRMLIMMTYSALIFAIGMIAFVVLELSNLSFRTWLIFIYTAEIMAILWVVLSSVWRFYKTLLLMTSLSIWIGALCIFLTFFSESLWLIFMISLALQVLILFGYVLLQHKYVKSQM